MATFDVSQHYQPYPKQRMAHAARVDELFYGGAKGGGKSFFLLWAAFAHCMKWGQDAHVVLFRRQYDELKNTLILEAKNLWPTHMDICRYVGNEHEFRFKNGALCQFRHLHKRDDADQHFGRQYTLICIDELTHLPSEEWYTTLLGSVRSPKNDRIFPRCLSASNPRGVGHGWVQRRFCVGENYEQEPMVPFEVNGSTRMFIPANVYDNKALMENDPEYVNRLEQMSEARRQAYLYGDWDVFENQAFPEFSDDIHVCESFDIPPSWLVIRVIDWGYTSSPFYIGWLAKDPETFTTYLFDEWYGATKGPQGGTSPMEISVADVAQGILDRQKGRGFPRPRTTVGDTSMWRREHVDQNSCIADLFMRHGIRPMKGADKHREPRKQMYHELMRISEDTGEPRFQVFSRCDSFIKCIKNMQQAEDGSEDVEKMSGDDPYDAVGYGLMELYPRGSAAKQKDPVIPEKYRDKIKGNRSSGVKVPI